MPREGVSKCVREFVSEREGVCEGATYLPREGVLGRV